MKKVLAEAEAANIARLYLPDTVLGKRGAARFIKPNSLPEYSPLRLISLELP